MRLPLYRPASPWPTGRDNGHAGLWFDKFCNQWRVDGSGWSMKSKSGKKDDNPKLEWIQTVTDKAVGTRNQIDEYALRLLRLTRNRGGRAEVFTTETRFVTGLGRSHPVENGFAWHPTLGTPFLPGSSVKGLVRSWAESGVDPRPGPELRARLLGRPRTPERPGTVGGVCFLDAVPVSPVRLEAEVMTPHYAGWDEDDPPGDWRSPTPIPFLATAAGTSFLFGFIPCRGMTGNELDRVSKWLCDALAWAGGGAKTAVGYGRFRPDQKHTRELTQRIETEERARREKRERKEAEKTPEGRWRLKLHGRSETEILDLVRIHLEKERLEDPFERRAFAGAVHSTGLVSCWKRGAGREKQTTVGKKKLKERARLVQAALEPDPG